VVSLELGGGGISTLRVSLDKLPCNLPGRMYKVATKHKSSSETAPDRDRVCCPGIRQARLVPDPNTRRMDMSEAQLRMGVNLVGILVA
jgi:hypothetical protein